MSIEEFNLITVTERITLTETDTPPSTKVTSETATTGEGQETSTLSPLPSTSTSPHCYNREPNASLTFSQQPARKTTAQ